MKALRPALFLMLILSFCGFAFAWPACSGNWIQVPAGTSSANGAVVTEGGQTFQCQKPSDGAVNNTNSNTNNNSSKSDSNAVSTAIAQGGSVKDSGNSSVKDSGNSSIKDSGNSSNTNTNTQGQKQQQQQQQGQTQSSTSSANNSGGNSSNSYSNEETYNAAKIPVATAYAPTAVATVPCALGYSGGGQGLLAGATGMFTRIDKTCQQLEVARSFALSGARTAYCRVMIQTKWAKKASVTMDDCMTLPAPVAAIAQPPAPVPVTVQPVVDVNPRPLQ